MQTESWTTADTERAEAIWRDYEQSHDVSDQEGRTAGVDPRSGRVWIGDFMFEVVEQMRGEGMDAPLYFVRIGSDFYFRRGGHR